MCRDLLRAQMFFDRHRIVSAALDGSVVTHDHAFLTLDAANAGDDAGRRRSVVVHVERGQLGEFQKRRTRIKQHIDPLAWQQLAACGVFVAGLDAAADGDFFAMGAQVVD